MDCHTIALRILANLTVDHSSKKDWFLVGFRKGMMQNAAANVAIQGISTKPLLSNSGPVSLESHCVEA